MSKINPDLLAPCGLYCGVCAVYISHRDNNLKFKEKLVNVYKPMTNSVDDVECTGCLSEGIVFGYCKTCPIKSCVKEKELEGCHQCETWPCKIIERFPIPVGKQVIMRAIPQWREYGTEKWIEEEENRYHCPDCANPLFRGVRKCNKCGISVSVD
ncbi:MAG: DUF3795 domain-containing protein [Promethearchaeota archaeon]|jgi:hypothetical protein